MRNDGAPARSEHAVSAWEEGRRAPGATAHRWHPRFLRGERAGLQTGGVWAHLVGGRAGRARKAERLRTGKQATPHPILFMREYLRHTIAGFSSGAMPAWQRWLCGIILTLAA